MIETLYKTQIPEKGKSECYVLVLTSRAASDGSVYAFMEEHGEWSDDFQRLIYNVKSIDTDEHLTYQQARWLYDMAKRKLTQMGFVHSFASGSLGKEPSSVLSMQANLATA